MRIFHFLAVVSVFLGVISVFTWLTGSLRAQQAPNPPSGEFASHATILDENQADDALPPGGDDIDGRLVDPDRPLWSVSAGTVILHRSMSQSSTLAENYNGTNTLLDASDFKFGWNAGADIGVTRRVDKYEAFDAIDFRYFGVQDWQANTSIETGRFWRFPSSPGIFANSAQIDASYTSQLHSAELNLQRDSSWNRLTWLAGVRWIGLDERLNMLASFAQGTPSNYTYSTQNNLYGGQIGAALKLWENGGPLHVNCVSKAGLYGNSAANRYENTDLLGGYLPYSSDRKDQAAFVGDLGVTAAYQWTEHVSLQGGYQLLWVQGATIAGDQPEAVSLTTNNGIASNGRVFYHGATASVNFAW
jgi:hypothetical protein